jgi:bifunctional ADP-heptose synthase (sugar kinase/adenylyltransferase)
MLEEVNIDTSGLLYADGYTTNTYIKPLRRGISDLVYEDPRIDFENYNPPPPEAEQGMISNLRLAAKTADVICVSDQMAWGCDAKPIIRELIALGREGMPVVVDSRFRINEYTRVILKPNAWEAEQATGEKDPGKAAITLSGQTGDLVIVTLGEKGCVLADWEKLLYAPALSLAPPVDPVGAGDAFMAALALAHRTA